MTDTHTATDILAARQAGRQANRQTDRHLRQTDKQTGTYWHTKTHETRDSLSHAHTRTHNKNNTYRDARMQAGPLHWKKNTTECFILGWHLQNAAPCLVLYPSPSTPTAAGFQEQEIPSDLAEEGPKECEVKSQSPKEVKPPALYCATNSSRNLQPPANRFASGLALRGHVDSLLFHGLF